MQRYRSGHNGADSKSVCRQLHVGSNPTRCATSERILLLLSNSNPLRWVAVWVLVQTWRRYLFELAMVFSYPMVISLFLIRGTIAKLLISLRLLKKCFGHSVIVWIPGAEKDCVTLSD